MFALSSCCRWHLQATSRLFWHPCVFCNFVKNQSNMACRRENVLVATCTHGKCPCSFIHWNEKSLTLSLSSLHPYPRIRLPPLALPESSHKNAPVSCPHSPLRSSLCQLSSFSAADMWVTSRVATWSALSWLSPLLLLSFHFSLMMMM